MAGSQSTIKQCSRCERELPTAAFSRDARMKDGTRTACRECCSQSNLRYRASAPNAGKRLTIDWFVSLHPHMKWCSAGQHFTSRTEFTCSSKSVDGLEGHCSPCNKAQWFANADRNHVRQAAYRAQHRDSINQGMRERYAQDKERRLIQNRKWREANPDKMKHLQRVHYQANKEAYKLASKKRATEKRDELREYNRLRYLNNKSLYKAYSRNRKARLSNAPGKFTRHQWIAKCEYWGWRCYLCGCDLKGMEVHIEHRKPVSRGGSNWIANIAPACKSCNIRKNARTESEYRASLAA